MWYYQIINLIYQFFYWFKTLFDFRDFDIKHRSVLYTIDDNDYDDATTESMSDFWKQESKKWDDGQKECWSIIDSDVDVYLTKPINVIDIIFYTKYYFNNHTYIRMSLNKPDREWPPSKRRTMRCTLPIRSARLVPSDNDTAPKDITNKIKRYAGPHNDFHSTEIHTSKMFNFTEEYLEEEYPTIEIENIIGQKTTIPSYTGSFTHQSLWSPSKTSEHQD